MVVYRHDRRRRVTLILLVITFFINVVARVLVWKVTKGQRAVVQE